MTDAERELALSLTDKQVWDNLKNPVKKRKRGLDPGEAECVAVAISRKWTLLSDDQAAVDVVKGLGQPVEVIRTCQLLVKAVIAQIIDCANAKTLFNDEICGRWGFYARRRTVTGATELLQLECDPPRCEWRI